MSKPKISVLMPSFNSGQYIAEAILSVAHQRYENAELIIFDGGSKDDTVAVIKSLEHHVAFWASEPDRGQTHALNKALEKATGDLVAVLNADDAYLPGAFDYVATMFSRNPEMEWFVGGCLPFGKCDVADAFPHIVSDNLEPWFYNLSLPHPSTFLTRKLMEAAGSFDEQWRYGMDYEYWLRLGFMERRPRLFPRLVSAFRFHEASKTVAEQDRFQPEVDKLREHYLTRFPAAKAEGIRKQIRIQRAKYEVYQALVPLRRGDASGAREVFDAAVARNPGVKKTRAYWTTLVRIKTGKV